MSSNRGPSSALLRPIPRRVRSLDGQTIDTSGDRWSFQSSVDGGQLLLLSWAALKQPAVFAAHAIEYVKLYYYCVIK